MLGTVDDKAAARIRGAEVLREFVKRQRKLSQSESPAEALQTAASERLTNPAPVVQFQTASTVFSNQASRAIGGSKNFATVEPPSDSSSNSFVIVSTGANKSIQLVSDKSLPPEISRMSPPFSTREQLPPLHNESEPGLRTSTETSTVDKGEINPLEPGQENWSIAPVLAEPLQEVFLDDKIKWRLRENQLLQIVNELETNLRGSRREAENQKIQVLATQQRLTSEIESLSRELFSLKNSLSTSRNDCTRLYEENARLRAVAAGLDEENQSLVFKLNRASQLPSIPQLALSPDAQSSTVLKPTYDELQLFKELRSELLNCVEVAEGETKKHLCNCVAKLDLCSSNMSQETRNNSSQIHEETDNSGVQFVKSLPEGKDLNQSSEIRKLQDKVNELNRNILEQSVFKNEMIRKNETLERRVQQVQEEKKVALDAMKQHMAQLVQENKRVTKDYLDQSKKAKSLRTSSDECMVKVGEVEGKFVFLEKELKSKSLALDISTEETTRHRKELTALKNQLDETRDRYQILEQNKEVLAKRCLSLDRVIEGIKMSNHRNNDMLGAGGSGEEDTNQEGNRMKVMEERYKTILSEKFALQKKCDEHDGRIHSLQEHIFDLEAEMRDRDEEIEIMRKQTIERETKLNLQKAEINKIISNAEVRKSSGEQAADLDEFGLRPADQDVLTQVLKTLFPSFFQDEGLRVI